MELQIIKREIIVTDKVDISLFLGVRDANFITLKNIIGEYVDLYIVGRTLFLKGDKTRVLLLEAQVLELLGYVEKYGNLNPKIVERFINIEATSSLKIGEDNRSKKSLVGTLEDTLPSLSKGSQEVKDYKRVIVLSEKGYPIFTKNEKQYDLFNSILKNDLNIVSGSAGSGKTFISVAVAMKYLEEKRVEKIILSRPVVEAGEKLGFLPGDIKEKLDPYLFPLYDAISLVVSQKKLVKLLEDKTIEILPLAYMRGRTLSKAFVILDEAQNATLEQIKMLLTRMGLGSKIVVNGDYSQIDLVNKKDSGFAKVIELLRDNPNIGYIDMVSSQGLRHDLVDIILGIFNSENV